eukprot:gb/GEZN01009083.1/.p1 GENE.gb/GEZN01009083.1/~~gb/GEZN01009083.1/.p1  ORF type:complete len:179 (-),score=26.13 gb/GEZN01009083.1/:220-756(-)
MMKSMQAQSFNAACGCPYCWGTSIRHNSLQRVTWPLTPGKRSNKTVEVYGLYGPLLREGFTGVSAFTRWIPDLRLFCTPDSFHVIKGCVASHFVPLFKSSTTLKMLQRRGGEVAQVEAKEPQTDKEKKKLEIKENRRAKEVAQQDKKRDTKNAERKLVNEKAIACALKKKDRLAINKE